MVDPSTSIGKHYLYAHMQRADLTYNDCRGSVVQEHKELYERNNSVV